MYRSFLTGFLCLFSFNSFALGGVDFFDFVEKNSLEIVADFSLTGFADNHDYLVAEYAETQKHVIDMAFEEIFVPMGCIYANSAGIQTLKEGWLLSWSELHAHSVHIKLACPDGLVESLRFAGTGKLYSHLEDEGFEFDAEADVQNIGYGKVATVVLAWTGSEGRGLVGFRGSRRDHHRIEATWASKLMAESSAQAKVK